MNVPKCDEKCWENCLVRPRQAIGLKTENSKKGFRFIHTRIFNPFYDKPTPSIVNPLKLSKPVEKHENLGFQCSDVRFFTSFLHSLPCPSMNTVYSGLYRYWNSGCPNGYGSMHSTSERFPDLCRLPETPGPADYTVHPNAWRKHQSFNKVSSDIFPVLYGTEPDCFKGNPAPNHYNVSQLPIKHCCNWRTYRSVFARKHQSCILVQPSVGPTQYDIKNFLTKPSLIQPVMASFKSGVSTVSSRMKLTKPSDVPGPQSYNSKFIKCWFTPRHNEVPKRLKKKAITKIPDITPGPGTYEIGRKPKLCGPVPTASFAKPSLFSKKTPPSHPGPADYFPKLRKRC